MLSLNKALNMDTGGTPPEGTEDDEPEAVVLLVACSIGLFTGGGVVLFNWAIHSIQSVAWGPVLLSQVSGDDTIAQGCTLPAHWPASTTNDGVE